MSETAKDFIIHAPGAKNCPFCGSDKITTNGPEWSRENDVACSIITCEGCGTRVDGFGNSYPEMYDAALVKWNRRADSEKPNDDTLEVRTVNFVNSLIWNVHQAFREKMAGADPDTKLEVVNAYLPLVTVLTDAAGKMMKK